MDAGCFVDLIFLFVKKGRQVIGLSLVQRDLA